MEIGGHSQHKNVPRSLQFQRMERIVKAMQHPTAGVPVRNQKLFLTTVPNAFTGNDVTEWIMHKLNVRDSGSLEIDQRSTSLTFVSRFQSKLFTSLHYFATMVTFFMLQQMELYK